MQLVKQMCQKKVASTLTTVLEESDVLVMLENEIPRQRIEISTQFYVTDVESKNALEQTCNREGGSSSFYSREYKGS